jgi:hypothetical protein
MFKTGFFAGLAVVLVAALMLGGCKKDEDGTGPGPSPTIYAPTNLKAFSASATSVGLQWVLSASESEQTFNNYMLRVKDASGALVRTDAVAKGTLTKLVAGLTEGVIYTFVMRSTTTSGALSSDSAEVKWSPARRYENESGSPPPIKVYETSSSSSYASGLIFFKPALAGPQTVSIVGSDSALIDVYVKTEANNAVSLNSSHIFRSGRRITRFSTIVRNDSTLDNPQAIPPDTSTFNNSSYLVDSVQVSSSRILYFKGNDGNYGRILIERSTAGRLIWGTSPEQYLSLRISYQSVAFNPYSKPTRVQVTRRD